MRNLSRGQLDRMRRFASTPHLEADPNEAACFKRVFHCKSRNSTDPSRGCTMNLIFFTLLQNQDPTLKESRSTQRECRPGVQCSSVKSCRFAAAAITSHATFPRMRGISFRGRGHNFRIKHQESRINPNPRADPSKTACFSKRRPKTSKESAENNTSFLLR